MNDRHDRRGHALLLCACLALSACGGSDAPSLPPVSAAKCATYAGPPLDALHHYEGTLHEHSSYSDGDIHSRPDDYYRAIRDAGYAFAGGSEHSDTLDTGVFISVGADCFTTPDGLLTCLTPTADDFVKWSSTAEQAATQSAPGFLAIRGFEWTSDRFGHINVYFSKNFSNAKTDLGYLVTMETFWEWFGREPDLPGLGGSITSPVPFGGGGDGLAHFNHPSDKCLFADAGDPGCNWNDYALVESAVARMFGMELYNSDQGDDRYFDDYVRALGKGWRLSPVGSEDEHQTLYASEERPKTVTIAAAPSEQAFREAWLARRTYALAPGQHLRAVLDAEGHPMGSTLTCDEGAQPRLRAKIAGADGSRFDGTLVLFDAAGSAIAQADGDTLDVALPPVAEQERWYFVRVHGADGKSVAYLAPVWVGRRP